MPIYLLLLPFLIIFTSLLLLRFNGRREIMRIDFVQFIYCFILVPLMFIWFKSLLFNLFKNEIGVSLSFRDISIIDTIFSTTYLFISSFIVIHSLTKTFDLKKQKDPLYDLYELTEYFHLTFSHFFIYGGALVIATLISMINIAVPVTVSVSTDAFYISLGIGVLAGSLFMFTVRAYKSASRRFLKIMKLFYAVGLIVHLLAYFVMDISFSGQFLIFWFMFMFFLSMVINSLLLSLVRRGTLPQDDPILKPTSNSEQVLPVTTEETETYV